VLAILKFNFLKTLLSDIMFTGVKKTLISDDPPTKQACLGKIYLPKTRMTPRKIKCLLKKPLLFILYNQYTQHVTFYISLPINVTVSFTDSAFTFLTLPPDIPQQITISSIHYIGYMRGC